LGPESGRVADSHGLGDETGIMLPPRMRTTSWDLGQSNSATNRLSTIRNGMGHFCSAIGWSLSSPDLTFQDNFLPSFCWLILLMSWRSCGGSGRRFFSRSRKAKEMDPRRPSPAVSLYGKGSTQKKFQEMLPHAAREGGISFGRCCVLKLSRQR
jgi:hypothetical protein